MSGSVRRRSNGSWEFRYDAGAGSVDGTSAAREEVRLRDRREAQTALRKAMTALEKGRSVRVDRRSVKSFLSEWHAAMQPQLRPTTWVNYRRLPRALTSAGTSATRLSKNSRQLASQPSIRAPSAERPRPWRTGLAPKTVQNVHRMLHRALADAVRWDVIPRNVAEDVKPPSVRRYRPRGLVTRRARDLRPPRPRRPVLRLVAARGHDRSPARRTCRPPADRCRTSRTVESHPRLLVSSWPAGCTSRSQRHAADGGASPSTRTPGGACATTSGRGAASEALGQDTDLLFVWPDGRPLHPDTITALFHRHCEAAGLPRIRLHDVRHSYATAALQAGCHPR